MFKLLSLGNIFFWIEKLTKFINSIFFVLLLVALSFALILSPPDYLQGDSVRIMYVHVPSAWIGLASFTSIALLSIANFLFNNSSVMCGAVLFLRFTNFTETLREDFLSR